ncbi:hypothetical protein A0256_03540 [Mucilaginibacter sp. PAMC 26640]|nr:hypothetical protein A0256_03540 [Mucilaginibacter sp. PAMC 26640]
MKRGILLITLILVSKLALTQGLEPKLNWQLSPMEDNINTAAQISTPGASKGSWIKAVVPGTVFHSYVVAGAEKNPDYADNIYLVDKAKYNRPYWYRTEFATKRMPAGKRTWLKFNGVNKMAEIWFNGHHIGTLKGLMQRGRYDLTDLLQKTGNNALAVLVTPPHEGDLANRQAPTYLSSGSWDWMPAVPGLNSGITDTVGITTTGPVTVEDPWIKSNLVNKKLAELNVNITLHNASALPVSGRLRIHIQPGNILFSGPQITLAAKSERVENYNKTQFQQLSIANPRLWWPNGYGGNANGTQILYTCTVNFVADGIGVTDKATKTFGIRKITSDTTSLGGPLRLFVNDVPILVKGGNWGMSDYMLKARGKDYDTRIRFHQDMNFNMIRNWTGEVTDEAFYAYCDKYGIMVWDDFWLNNFGPIDSLAIFKANAIEKVKKLRNHPSIVIWCGANEGLPGGDVNGPLNQAIANAIKDNDGDDRLNLPRSNAGVNNPNFSIHGGSRNLSGSGIWGNVDPKTYFTDPHNGYLFSTNSYGMRSELGTATFVNIESFKKFMPIDYWVAPTAASVDSKTNMWARHYFSTDGALGGGSAPVNYIKSINNSYGEATSLADFCRKAQLLNVETTKAMYEAWNDHMWKDASGLLMWMSQSAYPSMIWQTYDYYYDLTGAYFGVKKACEPIHIQWNAATNSVKVINNKPYAIENLTAEAMVYNADGKLVLAYTQRKKISVSATSACEAFIAFEAEQNRPALSDVHFLKLKLSNQAGQVLSDNFYWVGNTYLNYTALNKLAPVGKDLSTGRPVITTAANGVNKILTYHLTNKSNKTAAFGVRAQLLNGSGKQILPAIYSDGYFSLMQGESKSLAVEVDPKLLGTKYTLSLKAYNE